MLMGFKVANSVTPEYAVFGKLPRNADFVRINSMHPAVQEFDLVVAESMAWARLQASWTDEGYRGAEACEFHFVSRDGRWVFFGVLKPSADAAGRCYPLVAGIVLPASDLADHAFVLPLASELFFSALREQLANAIENSCELLSCRQFLDSQLSIQHRHAADVELASAVLDRHLTQTLASSLHSELLGSGCGGLEAQLLAFIFYAPLLRRYAGSAPRQVLLIPLPEGSSDCSLGLATWLALYRAACPQARNAMPHWVVFDRQGRRQVALAPEQLSSRILCGAWGGTPEPAAVIDILEERPPWMLHQSYAEASYILGRQLADPGLSLYSLREILGQLALSVA